MVCIFVDSVGLLAWTCGCFLASVWVQTCVQTLITVKCIWILLMSQCNDWIWIRLALFLCVCVRVAVIVYNECQNGWLCLEVEPLHSAWVSPYWNAVSSRRGGAKGDVLGVCECVVDSWLPDVCKLWSSGRWESVLYHRGLFFTFAQSLFLTVPLSSCLCMFTCPQSRHEQK